jgi:hypothetical protein
MAFRIYPTCNYRYSFEMNHFYVDEEIIEISPTIVGMPSSLEWSKFSAMLSSETTNEPEGVKFLNFLHCLSLSSFFKIEKLLSVLKLKF